MSIWNQTEKNWELIIVDDGSTDNTKEVVDLFLEQIEDKRIRYHWKKHEGLVAARNEGNSLAVSDFIAIQDSDDLSMPDRLEKVLPLLRFSDVVYHGMYTNMWEKDLQCISRSYFPALPFNKFQLLKGQYISGHPAFRKSLWKRKPFRMETQYCYDWMMHLDWTFSGANYKAINEGLYEYVRHENSASIRFEKEGLRKESVAKIKEIMNKEYGQQIT